MQFNFLKNRGDKDEAKKTSPTAAIDSLQSEKEIQTSEDETSLVSLWGQKFLI